MFTGIIETTGAVHHIAPHSRGIRLRLEPAAEFVGLAAGESVAVNGCCLTLAQSHPAPHPKRRLLEFDLLQETWNRTNFRFLHPGSEVNLERALRADGRLSGHFVSGHIDGVGEITRWEKIGADWLLQILPPADVFELLVPKGSIAADGISLTVARILKREFQIWIIPHTFAETNLRQRKEGDSVNLESDLLGKYVRQFVAQPRKQAP